MTGLHVLTAAYLACALSIGGAASVHGRNVVSSSTVQCSNASGPFPNPSDCGSFLQCEPSGNIVTHQCPAGLEFNAQLSVCDYPENAGCTEGSGQPPVETSKAPVGSTEAALASTEKPIETSTQQGPADDGIAGQGGEDKPNDDGGQPSGSPVGSTQLDVVTTAAPSETSSQESPSGDGSAGDGGDNQPNAQPSEIPDPSTVAATTSHATSTQNPPGNENGANGEDDEAAEDPDTMTTVGQSDADEGDGSGQNEPVTPTTVIPTCPIFDNLEDVIQLPNPNDCSSFYKCDAGNIAQLVPCPAGLEYNAQLRVCDHPEHAGCSSTPSPENSEEQPSDDGDDGETDDEEDERPGTPPQDVPACPALDGPDEAVQLPNPSSCFSFYKCDAAGVAWLMLCPKGLEYNAQLRVCDYPENAGCSSSQSHIASGEDTAEELATEADDGSDKPITPPADSPVCPSVESPEEAIQLPNPNDCSSFYKCDAGGTAWLVPCSSGLEYNAALQVCDYPIRAGCSQNNSSEDEGEDNDDPVSSRKYVKSHKSEWFLKNLPM